MMEMSMKSSSIKYSESPTAITNRINIYKNEATAEGAEKGKPKAQRS